MKLYEKIVIFGLILLLTGTGSAAAGIPGGPYVIISLDAETVGHKHLSISLPDQYDLKMDGTPCGMTRFMDICEANGVRATVFLSVYEYAKYGEDVLENISRGISARGFDVQLHTHPQWAYDRKRNLMHQYSLKEQTRIIREGKDLIRRWTGAAPVVHRAGAYAADENTMTALLANGIYYDSSYFFSSPGSLLQEDGLKKNYISRTNGVYQVPVNVFRLERYSPWFSRLSPLESIVKYDIDSTDDDTLNRAIDAAVESGFDAIVLFLHSFSFISEYSAGAGEPDYRDMEEFEAVLKHIKARKLPVLTFGEFVTRHRMEMPALAPEDDLPVVRARMGTVKYLARRVGIDRDNASSVLFVIIVIFAAAVAGYAAWRRKRAA